jgi:hypothetical protein
LTKQNNYAIINLRKQKNKLNIWGKIMKSPSEKQIALVENITKVLNIEFPNSSLEYNSYCYFHLKSPLFVIILISLGL